MGSLDFQDTNFTDEIVMIWDTTDTITSYNLINRLNKKETIKNIPNGVFLENNRYINVNVPKRVFIAGGILQKSYSSLFLLLERPSNRLLRLKDLPVSTIRQSMISLSSRKIAIVGGKNNRVCFFYDVADDDWQKHSCINYDREDATLFLFNNYLFIFGGLKEAMPKQKDYLIESVSIYEQTMNWQVHSIKINVPEKNLSDLRMISGSGIISSEYLKNRFFICGGYNNEESDEYNYIYELMITDQTTELTKRNDLHLELPMWFQEANFVEAQKKFFNVDVDGNLHWFSLDMEKFFFSEYTY